MKTIENGQASLMNSTIRLSGMEFYAHHGCFEEERRVGTSFKVDLVLEYDASLAAQTDNVVYAVNYQTVYSDVKEVMKEPVNLLETLCHKILSILKKNYPQVVHAGVTVYKMNPALGGKVGSVELHLKY